MSSFLETLLITSVKQTEINDRYIDIDFMIEDFFYQLTTKKNEQGIFCPSNVYHLSSMTDNQLYCSICGNNAITCSALIAVKYELFQELIQFPSIRLKWLYIPYAESGK